MAWSGSRAGNGAAMRCAPIAVRWRDDPVALVRNSQRATDALGQTLRLVVRAIEPLPPASDGGREPFP